MLGRWTACLALTDTHVLFPPQALLFYALQVFTVMVELQNVLNVQKITTALS
jgi:hypothetical protein